MLCLISDGLVFNLRLGSDWLGGAEGRSKLVDGQECWRVPVFSDVRIWSYELHRNGVDGVLVVIQ